jgi:16S rRNA (cytosine1402-N4)-methyltransferase
LAASSPNGWLFGCDRDGAALEAAQARLTQAGYGGRFELRRGNFAEMAGWVAAASCDGVLLDLGVSSPQLDEADRGFSFQRDGPLDMRMDRRQPLTAAVLVNTWDEAELARVLQGMGTGRHGGWRGRSCVSVREAAHHDRAVGGHDRTVGATPGRARHPAPGGFKHCVWL